MESRAESRHLAVQLRVVIRAQVNRIADGEEGRDGALARALRRPGYDRLVADVFVDVAFPVHDRARDIAKEIVE